MKAEGLPARNPTKRDKKVSAWVTKSQEMILPNTIIFSLLEPCPTASDDGLHGTNPHLQLCEGSEDRRAPFNSKRVDFQDAQTSPRHPQTWARRLQGHSLSVFGTVSFRFAPAGAQKTKNFPVVARGAVG